jgi:hypothetical protein
VKLLSGPVPAEKEGGKREKEGWFISICSAASLLLLQVGAVMLEGHSVFRVFIRSYKSPH